MLNKISRVILKDGKRIAKDKELYSIIDGSKLLSSKERSLAKAVVDWFAAQVSDNDTETVISDRFDEALYYCQKLQDRDLPHSNAVW